jgi:8-oxo-dGTP pyrophosphatase MutT (NUDIX family)
MAPDAGTIKSTKAIVFRLEHAPVDCLKFETCFKAKNFLLDKDKMEFLLFNSDEKITDLLVNNEEKFFKITWRQFKERIKRYVEGKALKSILELRQK